MPEYPDVTVYIEAIEARTLGCTLNELRVVNPFVLRTVEPAAAEFEGAKVEQVRRLGKRVALGFTGDLWAVVHMMIAGRFHWLAPEAKLHKTRTMLAFRFDEGQLQLTEAGKKRRASLHLVRGEAGLADHDRGGLEVMETDAATFVETMQRRNHTLKRALTDPRILSGIGNSFSDEILLRARMSPVALTGKLDAEQLTHLYEVTVEVLTEWTARLREEAAGEFPEKVTAFRAEMGAHGKYGEPCPQCETAIQRIKYADRETNYCPSCQTGGKLLADRGLSRLLKKDWPRSLEELENRIEARKL